VPRAVQLLGHVASGWRNRRVKLYLYDHPGEEVQSERRLGETQKFMHVLDGFVLIADPENGLGPDFAGFVGSLINWAEKNILRERDDRMGRKVAVVLAKADLPVVCEKIGDIRTGPIPGETVKAALQEWGHGHSLALLEANFRPVEYFACSALGPGESGEVRSHGVLDPIGWILTGRR
jgi:hypothetical protein